MNNREPNVLHEEKEFAVIEKPAGFVVHAARHAGNIASTAPLLTDWLVARYPEIRKVGDEPLSRPGIVHRLDKDTSGVMLIPRTQKAFEYFKHLFQTHTIQKTYLAVVFGKPKKEEGVIDAPIGIRNGTMKRTTRSAKMAKHALTRYKVVKTFTAQGSPKKRGAAAEDELFSLLEVRPETGRTHQIRVHLASIALPIVGDPLYGRKRQPEWATRLMLHAQALEFNKEDGRQVRFVSRPPFGSMIPAVIHRNP